MKVCVVGAGAIGGMVGVRLALSGAEVTLIARGAHLEAIKRDGLKLILNDGSEHIARDVKATDNMREAGPQDLIILALKAHQIAPVVDEVCSMFGPESVVLTMQNGIPWWYFQRHGGPYDGHVIKSLDPHGYLSKHIDPKRIIGCIAYPAAEVVRPGVIQHVEGDRFPIGEPSGERSERVSTLSRAMVAAGLKAPVRPRIRNDIWVKLWGNVSFNPISALTCATLDRIHGDDGTRAVARAMMVEAQAIGEALGVKETVPLSTVAFSDRTMVALLAPPVLGRSMTSVGSPPPNSVWVAASAGTMNGQKHNRNIVKMVGIRNLILVPQINHSLMLSIYNLGIDFSTHHRKQGEIGSV